MDESEANSSFSDSGTEDPLEELLQRNLDAFVKLQDERIAITKYISNLAKLKLRIDKDPLLVASQCLALKTRAPTSLEAITQVPPDPSLYCDSVNFQNYNTRKVHSKDTKEVRLKQLSSPNNSGSSENKVRGKVVADETKPSFNKLWSEDEQLLFEHLLDVYPLEKSELARCKKIADAMGTRTPQQVRSRMQKYYLKLKVFNKYQEKATAKSTLYNNRHLANLSYRVNNKMFRSSTFLPRYNVRESIFNDCMDSPSRRDGSVAKAELDPELKSEILSQLEEFQLQDSDEMSAEHIGYKCAACEEDPIVGPRWHCVLCIRRTDLCCACMNEYVKTPEVFASEQHQISHPFEVILTPISGTFNDPDYLVDNFDSNNYLDPNFLPE